MARRRVLTGFLLAAGSVGGTVFFRRRVRRRARVNVYFEDGSMVSLSDGSPDAATVLPLAQRIIDTARR